MRPFDSTGGAAWFIFVCVFGAVVVFRAAWRWADLLAAPLPGDKPGTRQSANSASSVASLAGAGYGVPNPMVVSCASRAPSTWQCVNRSAWLAVASFCDRSPCRDLSAHARAVGLFAALGAEGAPLAGGASAQAAGAQALPDGNHGDNKKVAEPTPGVTA